MSDKVSGKKKFVKCSNKNQCLSRTCAVQEELAERGFIFFYWICGLTRAMASSFLRFLDHKQRRITVGRTPLD